MERPNINIRDEKQKIVDLISDIKSFCFNFPTLPINFSMPSFKNDFDVIAFLMDLIISLIGKKAEELQREVTRWLIKNIKPLERDLRFDMKALLKSCYACKINPRIPPWLFVENPVTLQPGDGINIEVDQIDFACMLKTNPQSDVGRTIYGGGSDMNRFFFDVIQEPTGTSKVYTDAVTSIDIADFTFIEESSPVGTINGEGGIQDGDYRNNVINMKINNSYNVPEKNLIDFISDYLNSVVFFNTEKVVTQSMDLIFGVLTQKIDIDTACGEKKVEFEKIIDKMAECGLDDPNTEIDNSFFEFSQEEIVDIKEEAENRRKGIKVYKDCVGCKGKPASIDFASVLDLNDQLAAATDEAVKVTILEKGLGGLSNTSTNNISNDTDKNEAKFTFLQELINAIKRVIMRMTLSPKTMYLIIMMHYLVNAQARYRGVKEWMANIICLIRELLRKLLEKLTKEFLLILVLRGLKVLIKKYIKHKIKKKFEVYSEVKISLLPGGSVLDFGEKLANTVVDAGFDQAENAIAKKNDANNENNDNEPSDGIYNL